MYLSYLKMDALEELQATLSDNLDCYTNNASWLGDWFGERQWFVQSGICVDDFTLKYPEVSKKYDLENTITLYNAMRHLTITQATDERLWTFLTHETFWKYMRLRWPAEKYIDPKNNEEDEGFEDVEGAKVKDPRQNIQEHYFFMSNPDRALIRNGLSRLWWYGYSSYDENRENPYELTAILLSKLDITQNLLERSYSRNPNITRTVLSVLAKQLDKGRPLPNRKQFRELTKYLNRIGGVTVLDALDIQDLERIIENKLVKLGCK